MISQGRTMRRFITAHDVEIVALTGRDRLIIDEDDVVTAIAREMAAKMGVTIAFKSRESTPEPVRTPSEPSPPPAAPPRCERRRLPILARRNREYGTRV